MSHRPLHLSGMTLIILLSFLPLPSKARFFFHVGGGYTSSFEYERSADCMKEEIENACLFEEALNSHQAQGKMGFSYHLPNNSFIQLDILYGKKTSSQELQKEEIFSELEGDEEMAMLTIPFAILALVLLPFETSPLIIASELGFVTLDFSLVGYDLLNSDYYIISQTTEKKGMRLLWNRKFSPSSKIFKDIFFHISTGFQFKKFKLKQELAEKDLFQDDLIKAVVEHTDVSVLFGGGVTFPLNKKLSLNFSTYLSKSLSGRTEGSFSEGDEGFGLSALAHDEKGEIDFSRRPMQEQPMFFLESSLNYRF